MNASCRPILNSPGCGCCLVSGRERAGNEAMEFRRYTNSMEEEYGRERVDTNGDANWFQAGDGDESAVLRLASGRGRVGNEAIGARRDTFQFGQQATVEFLATRMKQGLIGSP